MCIPQNPYFPEGSLREALAYPEPVTRYTDADMQQALRDALPEWTLRPLVQALHALLPRAHFATIYAKPAGKPLVDTFVTEVSQDTWILFPWDTEAQFIAPIIKGAVRP